MISLGIALMIFMPIMAVLAAIALDHANLSKLWENLAGFLLVLAVIGFFTGMVLTVRGQDARKHERRCTANHEVLVKQNDTAMYQGKTILFKSETCVVFL